jgi:hypothetical protein
VSSAQNGIGNIDAAVIAAAAVVVAAVPVVVVVDITHAIRGCTGLIDRLK